MLPQPKVVLAKLHRSATSLRAHGTNASLVFVSPTRLVVTTTTGHHLLYSINRAPPIGGRTSSEVYVLPGGPRGSATWARGPGEGRPLEGVVIRSEGERSMAVGDGVSW